jgi:glutathione S-transferase
MISPERSRNAALALMHKGLPFDTIPWRFTDKNPIAFSGQGRVPVLIDGDQVVFDSWTIANYLEDAFPDRPSLFRGEGGRVVTRFVNAWADGVLIGGILQLIVTDILAHLDEKDRTYFHDTREKRLGTMLEMVSADRETNVLAFRKTLEPIRTLLAAQLYFGGEAPAYADYAVFGCFQWARCTSSFQRCSRTIRSGRGAIACCPRLMDLRAKRLVTRCDTNSAEVAPDAWIEGVESPTRSRDINQINKGMREHDDQSVGF